MQIFLVGGWAGFMNKMKSSLEATRSYFETGDGTGYIQAVWFETEQIMKLALAINDAQFLGSVAGLVFARREHAYDKPYLGTEFQ